MPCYCCMFFACPSSPLMHTSIGQSIHQSINQSTCPSIHSLFYLCMYTLFLLPIYPSIHQDINLLAHRTFANSSDSSIHAWFFNLCTSLVITLFISLYGCVFVDYRFLELFDFPTFLFFIYVFVFLNRLGVICDSTISDFYYFCNCFVIHSEVFLVPCFLFMLLANEFCLFA